MKQLLTALAMGALLSAPFNPLLAEQHTMGQQGGGKQSMDMEQERSQEMADEAMKESEQTMERERERMQSMEGEGSGSMEREREMSQQQMEQGEGSEKGEEKRERKWWRFWE